MQCGTHANDIEDFSGTDSSISFEDVKRAKHDDKVLPNLGKLLRLNHEGQCAKVEKNYHFKEEGKQILDLALSIAVKKMMGTNVGSRQSEVPERQ